MLVSGQHVFSLKPTIRSVAVAQDSFQWWWASSSPRTDTLRATYHHCLQPLPTKLPLRHTADIILHTSRYRPLTAGATYVLTYLHLSVFPYLNRCLLTFVFSYFGGAEPSFLVAPIRASVVWWPVWRWSGAATQRQQTWSALRPGWPAATCTVLATDYLPTSLRIRTYLLTDKIAIHSYASCHSVIFYNFFTSRRLVDCELLLHLLHHVNMSGIFTGDRCWVQVQVSQQGL